MLKHVCKPVVFNLDDFCEEIMEPELWDLLFELKNRYSRLKITMFTIPFKCREAWLRQVAEHDWLELHYHGTSHEDRDEWLGKTEVELPFGKFFYRGFKAPWWRMDQSTADILDRQGFLLSVKKGYFDVDGSKVYRYNLGREIIPHVQYENERYHTMHSHVQRQKYGDGLPQIFDQVIDAYPANAEFLFISELFGGNCETGTGDNNL